MINIIRNAFEQRGYLSIQIDLQEVFPYYLIVESKVYVVSLVDYIGKYTISKEHYVQILNRIRDIFLFRGFQDIEILTIVCVYGYTDREESYWNFGSYWILDMKEKNLIIYENQIGKFLDVDTLIHEAMDQRNGRKNLLLCNNVIIALNILMFLLVEVLGSSQNAEFLVKWGAIYWPNITEQGEYYRLFTHMFLHFGIEHLLNNMFVLGFVGYQLEYIVGKGKFLTIYLVTGIIAGMASMEYNKFANKMVVSAGASGAIFGVVGAMAYVVAVNKGKIPNFGKTQMIIFIFLSLYGGFTSQQVDNVAHIGGLVAGFILGALCYKKQYER